MKINLKRRMQTLVKLYAEEVGEGGCILTGKQKKALLAVLEQELFNAPNPPSELPELTADEKVMALNSQLTVPNSVPDSVVSSYCKRTGVTAIQGALKVRYFIANYAGNKCVYCGLTAIYTVKNECRCWEHIK